MELVIHHLQQQAEAISLQLSSPELSQAQRQQLIAFKNQIRTALQSIQICQQWQITPRARIHRLPPQKTRTPSSEYRLMEDCETEQREYWQEAQFDGETLRFSEFDLLVQLV